MSDLNKPIGLISFFRILFFEFLCSLENALISTYALNDYIRCYVWYLKILFIFYARRLKKKKQEKLYCILSFGGLEVSDCY